MSMTNPNATAVVPRRRQPRWTDEEFKTLLEATCMCGANFERIGKVVGVRRAPDACRKQLRVVAERLLFSAPETSEACVFVVLARFGLEHPPSYEGQSFADVKDSVFVQAMPRSEKDELEVRRRERNPLVQMKSSSARTMWDVMYHLFFKWGLPIVLCNPDGSVISPDEPTGSVLARLQTPEDEDSYVRIQYRVLQLNIDDELLAQLRTGSPPVPRELSLYNEAVGENQRPPQLNFATEVLPALDVVPAPTPEVAPNAINPSEIPMLDISNLPAFPPPPPLPPRLPDGLDLLTDVAMKFQRGWTISLSNEGRTRVLPPLPPPLPPRRICNSRRTYAWPPSSNSIEEEDAIVPSEGVQTRIQELDGALFGTSNSSKSKKPPTGKKKAVPAQRRIAKKDGGKTKTTPKRQRVVTTDPQMLPVQEAPSTNGDEVMKKWAARLQTMEAEIAGGKEVFETQEAAVQNDVQPQNPEEGTAPALEKTDSMAQNSEVMLVENGNSTVIRMFRNISSHAQLRETVKNADDSIALEARQFGFENHEENASSLPNNNLFGRSTSAGVTGGNHSRLDLNLTVGVDELDISQLPPPLPQGASFSGLFGSKENSRIVSTFLRSEASLDRVGRFQSSDNALDVFADAALTAQAEARNPQPNFPSLNFSGMFGNSGALDDGKKPE